MAGGQAGSGVTLREDLKGMLEELTFEELGLQADNIATVAPVSAVNGAFPVNNRENAAKVPDTKRKSDGSYTRGTWEWGQDNYVSREYGFEEPVDLVQALENENFFDEEVETSKLAAQGVLLGREYRVSSALWNTTTFTGAANTTSIAEEWDTDSTTAATPWADIDGVAKKLRNKCGIQKKFQSLMLTWDNIDYCIRTQEVINHAKYVEILPVLTMEQKIQWLASYFGVKEIIPVLAVYDTADLNQDFSYGHLWSNEFGMICVRDQSSNSLQSRSVAVQPVFNKLTNDLKVETYEEPANNRRIYRVSEHRDIKIRTDYGVLIQNMKSSVSGGV